MDVLGLARDASFDRALSAKNKLAARQQDPQKLMEVRLTSHGILYLAYQ